MNSIRIVSDGRIPFTHVQDAQTGKTLGGVERVVIHPMRKGDLLVRATVTFTGVALDVTALPTKPNLWRRLLTWLRASKPAEGTT